jgi:hypothetical protein
MDLAIDFVRRCPEEYKQILFVLEDGQKRNIFLDHFVLKEGNRSVSRTNEISHVTKPLDEHLRALFRNNYTVQDLEVALRRVCETTDSVMHSFKEAVQRIKEVRPFFFLRLPKVCSLRSHFRSWNKALQMSHLPLRETTISLAKRARAAEVLKPKWY